MGSRNILRREINLVVRASSFAVPLTVALGIFLGITKYPVEEWPFVAGIFAASLLLSGSLVTWLLPLVGKKLNGYGHLVLAERGVDVDAVLAEAPVPKAPWVILSVVFVLLLIGTVWGLALNILVFISERMGMPPFGADLPLVAASMFLVGSCGLGFGLSLHFALIHSIKRLEQQRILVSSVTRFVFNVARAGERSAPFWRVVVFLRSGTG